MHFSRFSSENGSASRRFSGSGALYFLSKNRPCAGFLKSASISAVFPPRIASAAAMFPATVVLPSFSPTPVMRNIFLPFAEASCSIAAQTELICSA